MGVADAGPPADGWDGKPAFARLAVDGVTGVLAAATSGFWIVGAFSGDLRMYGTTVSSPGVGSPFVVHIGDPKAVAGVGMR